MKFFAITMVVLQALFMQNASSQVIRTACASPIIAQPSVAAALADTLSLLTVSSLLSESLPLNPNVIATVPVPVAAPACAPACGCAPTIAYGGCGCGCGGYYNGCGCGGYYMY